MAQITTLTALLEQLQSSGSGARLTLGEVLAVTGERGFGPLILVVALIGLLPTGAIPGVPTVCGLSIALIAAQLVMGKRHPWLPQKLRGLSIKRARYERVVERIKPWTRRIDHLVHRRLHRLTEGVAARIVGLLCLVLALLMPPLELLPFAAAAPAGGIAFMALGLAGQDGLWVLLGLVPAGLGGWLVTGLAVQ